MVKEIPLLTKKCYVCGHEKTAKDTHWIRRSPTVAIRDRCQACGTDGRVRGKCSECGGLRVCRIDAADGAARCMRKCLPAKALREGRLHLPDFSNAHAGDVKALVTRCREVAGAAPGAVHCWVLPRTSQQGEKCCALIAARFIAFARYLGRAGGRGLAPLLTLAEAASSAGPPPAGEILLRASGAVGREGNSAHAEGGFQR